MSEQPESDGPSESIGQSDPSDSTELSPSSKSLSLNFPEPSEYEKKAKYPRKFRYSDIAGPSGYSGQSDTTGPNKCVDPSETAEPTVTPKLAVLASADTYQLPSYPRLPRPTSFITPTEGDEDLPETSDGSKVRSYPHVRGQWTTFIYGEVSTDLIENIVDEIRAHPELTVFEPDEIHLTLVRGHYALRHHQIYPFLNQLEKRIQHYSPFAVCLSTVKLFENEQGTRCFIVLCEKTIGGIVRHKKIFNAIEETLDLFSAKVKSTLAQIQARKRDDYDEFIFHTSLAWCLPERRELALAVVDKLMHSLQRPVVVQIEKVKVHIGHKIHCIPLYSS